MKVTSTTAVVHFKYSTIIQQLFSPGSRVLCVAAVVASLILVRILHIIHHNNDRTELTVGEGGWGGGGLSPVFIRDCVEKP